MENIEAEDFVGSWQVKDFLMCDLCCQMQFDLCKILKCLQERNKFSSEKTWKSFIYDKKWSQMKHQTKTMQTIYKFAV